MILSLLRDTPIVSHYSLFSRSRLLRTRVALILYAVAIVTFNIVVNVGPGRHTDDYSIFALLLETVSFLLLPSVIFLAFAPKYYSREFLEELTLTRMSRREVVAGFCLPPLLMFAFIVAINLATFALFSLWTLSASRTDVPVSGYLLVAIYHVLGAVIAASAIIRNWTAHPGSIFRSLVQVPILCIAYAIVIAVMTLSVALCAGIMIPYSRYEDELLNLLSLLVSVALTSFPILKAVRFATSRFFRSVDSSTHEHAYWAANEFILSRKRSGVISARKHLLLQALLEGRLVLRALVLVLLPVLVYAIYAYNHPLNFAPYHDTQQTSVTKVDKQLAVMSALANSRAIAVFSILYLLIHLYLRTRSHPHRALTIMVGGIIPSVISSLFPALVLFVAWMVLAAVAGHLILYRSHFTGEDFGEWILHIMAFFTLSPILTMLLLPRPRRLLLRIIFLLLGLPTLTFVFQYLLSLPDNLQLSSGLVVFAAISVVALAGIAFFAFLFRKSHWKLRFVAVAGVTYGTIPIVLSLTLLSGDNSERLSHTIGSSIALLIISLFLWLITFGFDVLAQRIHRLELAHLEPLTLNTDAIPRSQADS